MDLNFHVREVLFLMKNEYEVLIEDLNPPEGNTIKMRHVLKRTIRRTINERLRSKLAETRKPKGLEIDVPSEWTDILHKDSSILTDYRGDLVRSWLSFRSEASASKER